MDIAASKTAANIENSLRSSMDNLDPKSAGSHPLPNTGVSYMESVSASLLVPLARYEDSVSKHLMNGGSACYMSAKENN